MSKTLSYLVVGLVAFLAGGVASHLVSCAETPKTKPGSAGVQRSAEATRAFALEGMTCQGCADTITAALKQVPGVRSAKVSLHDRQALVSADESQVSDEKILAAIAAAGYKGHPASLADHAAAGPATSKSPILVNITRGKSELHAVSMALGLSQSALKDDRAATVFLNVDAPVLAAKDLGDDVKFADFPPVKKMLADFMAAGGRVLICGHCAHVAELKSDAMIDGAKVVGHGELLDSIKPGTVVFSY